MAFVSRTFDSEQELIDYLNDIVVGKELGLKVQGLDGLTLIINDGGADRTVTFSDPNDAGLTVKEIMTEIKGTHANLVSSTSTRNYGHSSPPKVKIAVTEVSYIVRSTGTANSLLGFSTGSDTTVGANAVAKADIVTILKDGDGNRFTVIHE